MTRVTACVVMLAAASATLADERQTGEMSFQRVQSKLFRHQSTAYDREFCGSEVCVDFDNDGDGSIDIIKSIDNYKKDDGHDGVMAFTTDRERPLREAVRSGTDLRIGEPVRLSFGLSTTDPTKTPKLDSYSLVFDRRLKSAEQFSRGNNRSPTVPGSHP